MIEVPKIMTVLSLGLGVQSFTLLMLAEDGVIPRPDAAIVSDTGDEAEGFYEMLSLARTKTTIPIHVVKEGNGLGVDFLDALGGSKSRASQPPFYVRAPDMTPDEIASVLAEPEPKLGDFRDGLMATALEHCMDEELQLFGVRSMAEEWLANQWTAWNLRRRKALNKDEGGMLWRACTRDYKIIPIRRKVRELMDAGGFTHVQQQIGISTDERQRENESGVGYVTNVHPLLEMGWSRRDCEHYLFTVHGLVVPKSACVYCPYRSNAGWRWMKLHDPRSFERACQYDEAIRDAQGKKVRGAGIVGELFVHRSFTPLRTAQLDDIPGQMDFGFEQECTGMCGF